MASGTDTLFMLCTQPGCSYEITKRVPCGGSLPPYLAIRWHLRMVAHLRAKHLRRRR